jgi:hypothetical protein
MILFSKRGLDGERVVKRRCHHKINCTQERWQRQNYGRIIGGALAAIAPSRPLRGAGTVKH